MKEQANRKHKTESEELSLLDTIKKLLEKYDADEVFSTLVAASKDTTDETYLTDEVISYLNIWRGMNVVKVEGLSQQMEFEEKMKSLFPYQNQQKENLFTIYL